jgi:hypothetical protein
VRAHIPRPRMIRAATISRKTMIGSSTLPSVVAAACALPLCS